MTRVNSLATRVLRPVRRGDLAARLDAAAPTSGARSPGVIAVTFSKLNKAGFVIALLLGVADLASPLQPTPDGENGPPFAILLIDAVLGLITIVAVVIAWRTGRRGAVRIAAGARIVSMVTALPAFFAGVSADLLLIVSLFVVVTIGCVALMLLPSRTPVPVSD